jgi:hypothetical protein
MNQYRNDPRQITARFSSTCHTCGKKIEKGEQIIYWPLTKNAGHIKCDEADFRKSLESFEDEERYHGFGERHSDYLTAMMFETGRNPGESFYPKLDENGRVIPDMLSEDLPF